MPTILPKTYTPQQAAEILQLSTATIYKLIDKGEIMAKKIGNVYRIPETEFSFAVNGLDNDLQLAEEEDKKKISQIQKELDKVRKAL